MKRKSLLQRSWQRPWAAKLVALVCLAGSQVAAADPVRIIIQTPTQARVQPPEPGTAWIVARSAGGDGKLEVRRQVTIPTTVNLQLAGDRVWTLELAAPGLWAETKAISLFRSPGSSAGEDVVTLRPWVTGTVRGQLRSADPNLALPATALLLRFQPVPDEANQIPADRPKGVLECPLTDNAWSCELPAGIYDLRLRLKGFVSQYRWGLPVEAGTSHDLGTLLLQPGASVVGWLEVAEGDAAESEARAILRPLQAGATRAEARDPREHLSQRVRVNDRGFFHFDGVAPGTYQLEVYLAGYAMVRQPPIEVLERTEAELQGVVQLFIPKALEVIVDPPADLAGKSWRVQLIPLAGPAAPLDFLDESDAPDGRWRRGALAPGQYRLMVRDSQRSLWYHEEFQHTNEDQELLVSLPLIPIEGTVRLGGEPLAARLSFGKRGRSVPLESDAEGHFEGYLTDLGTWKVKVEAEQPTVRRWLEVAVERAAGQQQARVELDLPDGTVRGVVVDEQGGSAKPPATVYAMLVDEASPGISSYVDRQGRFEFRGLPAGRVELTAEAPGDQTSVPALVEVRKYAATESVRLVLRKRLHVFGQVTAHGAPVPGARVELFAVNSLAPDVEELVTGVDGWFETTLTPGSRELFVRVFAPGYALRILRILLVEGQPLDLRVDRLGGRLVLEVAGEAPLTDWHADRILLAKDGNPLALSTLRGWATLHGVSSEPQRLDVPYLEAGAYQLCSVPAQHLNPGARDRWRCVEGYLPPLGELVLTLPVEK